MQAKWFWFEQFRHGGVNSTACRRQMLDTFVDSVYVFDDRVALKFNFQDASKIVTREEVLGSGVFLFAAGQHTPRQQKSRAPPVGRQRPALAMFTVYFCSEYFPPAPAWAWP